MAFETVPQSLKDFNHWVCWNWELRGEKQTKVPYMATEPSRNAKPNDPATWGSFEQAVGAVSLSLFNGVGFVFSSEDPFVGIDLDKCIDSETGTVEDWAKEIIEELNSYTEYSPSGRGVHIIVKGTLPSGQRRKGQIEMYDCDRYFTVTGKVYGTPKMIEDRQEILTELHKRLFPLQAPVETIPVGTDFITGQSLDITPDDNKLIDEITASKQGAKFNKLYSGIWEGDYTSQSEADSALCMILAFWTKKDPDRMNRIFQNSKLMRPKWNEVHYSNGLTYGQNTVAQAIGLVSNVKQDKIGVNIGDFYEPNENEEAETIGQSYDWKENNLFEVDDLEIAQSPDTHLANAFRLAKFHGHELIYVRGEGWLWFNGSYWEQNKDKAYILAGRVGRYVRAEANALYRKAIEASDETEQKKIRAEADKLMKWSRQCEMKETMNATVATAQGTMAIPVADIDANPYLLCVSNGTLDLEHHTFTPHSSLDLITKMSPVEFDKDATAPLWIEFLNTIFEGNQELIDYMQLIFGYCLTALTNEQAFFFFYGQGSNGKSKLTEILALLLGQMLATQTVSEFMQASGDRHSTEIAELRGYRVAITSEAEAGKKFASKRLKQLSGESTVKARKLYENNMEFSITFKLFLTANHKPPTDDLTNSFWRRLKIIPFNVTFSAEGGNGTIKWDRNITEKLVEQLPGILNWSLEGFKKWQQTGLVEPKIVTNLGEQYRGEQNNVLKFIKQRCRQGEREQPNVLWAAYEFWFENNKDELDSSEKVGKQEFYKRLGELGYPRVDVKGVSYFKNLILRTDNF